MIPVHKLAKALDNETQQDFLDKLKKEGMCRETITQVKQMSKRERE